MITPSRIIICWFVPVLIWIILWGPPPMLPIFVFFGAMMIRALILLAFLCLILLPIEKLLNRLKGGGAMLVIAPSVGWLAARIFAWAAHQNPQGLLLITKLGVTSGLLWGISKIVADKYFGSAKIFASTTGVVISGDGLAFPSVSPKRNGCATFLLWVGTFVIVLVGLFAWHYRTITIAYRLTLEVQVDGETHIGSGVIGAYWGRNANPLTTAVLASSIRGEAVVVDLGRYGPLFLVLRGKYDMANLPHVVFSTPNYDLHSQNYYLHQNYWDQLLELTRPMPPREIPHDALPLLVRFRDINQPSTAECVNPNDMKASFPTATSITLVHAMIEIVDEPVTKGTIEKWLPWLGMPRQEMGRLLTGPIWRTYSGVNGCALILQYFERTR